MNKNDNCFIDALATALHKMVERERCGAVDCYGWNYQPKRPKKTPKKELTSKRGMPANS
ncbi:MAG: hypothetical protein UCO57_09165 [Gemmiger sp.]|uniref:hypothetical protein n=1 Tax=Gemmiger sp. TaxID=2049027 RepID=UPI002E79C599|nr:hypothetical protein [Gemmiger sp.]MEE0708932.1 hypothetical protein [Gemmiger sp.]